MVKSKWFCYVINSISSLLYRREYKNFINTKSVEQVQQKKLMDIIKNNESTDYGKKYKFDSIDSVLKYQQTVPLTTYEDYDKYIEEIKNGKNNVLTKEKVLLLEPTSGSTSASKYIPYTNSLKKEFQKALKPWIYNLYTSNEDIKWGKSYWSITPVTKDKEYTVGVIPIGFEEDTEYFGFFEKKLFEEIFAVDGSVAKVNSIDEFYYETSIQLLMTKNLTLISVWNPTFLILILEYIEKNIDKLYDDMFVKDKDRAKEIKNLVLNEDYESIWSELKVISCWCDGNAKKYSKSLEKIFLNVEIQPKGLLATEGVISFPFKSENGARLSIYSHFYEFESIEDGQIYLSHQIEKGKEYCVIITTSGGLYRYRLNDVIEVTDIIGIFPLIKFKGKKDKVSDMFGEKLNEEFLKTIMQKNTKESEFYMFAPRVDRYVLYIKSDIMPKNIDEKLRENFHYDYCRKLGQLKELKIFKLTGNPKQEYINGCVEQGQRIGDIKSTALSLKDGWDEIFKGEYI